LLFLASAARASRVNELKNQISDKSGQIAAIEKEIEAYEKQIDATLKEKKTLKNEIYLLRVRAKKLNTGIYLTEKKIEASDLTIKKLALEIGRKAEGITGKKDSLAEVMRKMNEMESKTMVEITLANDTLSDFFSDLEQMNGIQEKISVNLKELKKLKEILQTEKTAKEKEKERQEELREELVDQKVLVNRNKKRKDTLLWRTKNKEANYRKILSERKARQKALENEIRELEQQIRIEIDPNSLPPTGTGVLKWPLKYGSAISCWGGGKITRNCVTQFFGNTSFATKSPQIYKGKGHRGIDLRAGVGTKVTAAAGGVVRFVYRDKPCTGAYYGGKWILIDHGNNLSTLYAHLSLIKVVPGQRVKAGQFIGYSGESGYVTGPHLHFTVFATKAVRVTGENGEKPYFSKVCKGVQLKIPISPNNGYLNPLSYLPNRANGE